MILNRLLVRERLAILVAAPLVAIVALTVPFLADQADQARAATHTVEQTGVTQSAAEVVQELQHERLMSIAYLADRGMTRTALIAQDRDSIERLAKMRSEESASKPLTDAMAGLDRLRSLRVSVLNRTTQPAKVLAGYKAAIDPFLAAVEESTPHDKADHVLGVELEALQALIRNDEAANRIGSALLAYAAGTRTVARQVIGEAKAQLGYYGDAFKEHAIADHVELFEQIRDGTVEERIAVLVAQAENGGPLIGAAGITSRTDLLRAVSSQHELQRLIQEHIVKNLDHEAGNLADGARTAVTVAVVLLMLLMAGLVTMGIIIIRSIARPLRRLTTAAATVADFAQTELVRASDESEQEQPPPRLAAIDVASNDELGDLAATFNRVQATASLLVERQVETRRSVADMFSSVAHRTQNLVARQLALIDALERNERDPDVLAQLYRLDQVCTRLRRSANSLLVVSGVRREGESTSPVPLPDVLRTALSEVEEYSRFQLGRVPDVSISGFAAVDLALLFAEVCDNAAQFSAPTTRIEIDVFDALHRDPIGYAVPLSSPADPAQQGYVARIADHGIGLSMERLEDLNHRLVSPERIDAAPTRMLGLFVVARLSRRHGLSVRLDPTPGGGITALVSIPPTVIAAAPAADGRAPMLVLSGAGSGTVIAGEANRGGGPNGGGPRAAGARPGPRPAAGPRAADGARPADGRRVAEGPDRRRPADTGAPGAPAQPPPDTSAKRPADVTVEPPVGGTGEQPLRRRGDGAARGEPTQPTAGPPAEERPSAARAPDEPRARTEPQESAEAREATEAGSDHPLGDEFQWFAHDDSDVDDDVPIERRGGLSRRRPGAQLPSGTQAAAGIRGWRPDEDGRGRHRDPDYERDELRAFQAVPRAIDLTVIDVEHDEDVPDRGPRRRSDDRSGREIADYARTADPGYPDEYGDDRDYGDDGPEMRGGLPRRVPGRNVSGAARSRASAPRPAPAGYRYRDAEAERRQLDQFVAAMRRGAAADAANTERTPTP